MWGGSAGPGRVLVQWSSKFQSPCGSMHGMCACVYEHERVCACVSECEQVCARDQDHSCSSRRGTAPKRQRSTTAFHIGVLVRLLCRLGGGLAPRSRREGKAARPQRGPSQALWMCVSLLGWGHPSAGPHPHHSEAPLDKVFHSNRLKHRCLQGPAMAGMSRVHGRPGGPARRGTATGQPGADSGTEAPRTGSALSHCH